MDPTHVHLWADLSRVINAFVVLHYVRELLSSTIAIATHRVRSSPQFGVWVHFIVSAPGDAIVVQRDLRSEGNCLSRG